MPDQGVTAAFWSPRHTDRLLPVEDMIGWSLDACARSIGSCAKPSPVPVGPEFIPPPRVTQRDGLWPRKEQLLINDSLDPLVGSPRPHGRFSSNLKN
jgi:hypothetical protein